MIEPAPLFSKLYVFQQCRVSKTCYGREGKAWGSSVHVQFGELIGPGMVSTDLECSQFWDLQLKLLMGKGFILAFWIYSCPPLKPQLEHHNILFGKLSLKSPGTVDHDPTIHDCAIHQLESWFSSKGWFYLSGDIGQLSGDIFDWHYLSLLLVFSGWRPVMLVLNNGRCWLFVTSLEERYDSFFIQ